MNIPSPRGTLNALIVDWGGVLTGPLATTIEAWAEQDRVDLEAYFSLIDHWLGSAYAQVSRLNPIHALETGQLAVPDFEAKLKHAMEERTGHHFDSEGVVARMFSMFEHAPDMNGLVYRARAAGLRTALLSNSWGNDYPRDGWDEMFDAAVISHEVGMRKPDPAIYLHTCEMLGVMPSQCVFVDDLKVNVDAAVDLGMVAVLHRGYDDTLMQLQALFGLDLA
ncbi:MAG: HAD family phosphatase [Actinomycetales bacterium]|nr:HAD family phosphatase [Actinomycetales bacterium]